jgi:ribosomal protein L11 methyltransferase
MSWNQLTLDVPDDLKDAIVGELSFEGVSGVWEEAQPRPGHTRLVIYFGPESDLRKIENRVATIFARTGLETPGISREMVEDCDWTEEWKKSYTSFPIGNDFFVIPSWENTPCPDDRLPIRIDPGQAFGTGTHETTQLTIEGLERWVEPNHVVLDVGTGSGILAIASRLLGAREVIACDIDSVAARVAHANVERNAENEVWTFCGSVDAVRSNSVHLVLCNMTADLITALLAEIDRVLQPRGIAIFSGILREQNEEIYAVIAGRRFTVHEELTRGEWVALIAQKLAEKHVA